MSALVQVFAEYPQAGKVKKRMIPSVGEQGAVDCHVALIEDLLWRLHGSVDLEVWGTASATKKHYQSYIDRYHCGYQRQSSGDPGIRMEHAFSSAFLRSRVPLLINTACPFIDLDLIDAMTEELDDGADAVMVPAENGSYVALGLAVKNYQLFRGIDWYSKNMADQTLARMFNTGVECVVFEPVQSVEKSADLKKVDLLLSDENDAELCRWMKKYL